MSRDPNAILERLHTAWRRRQASQFGDVFVGGVGNDESPNVMVVGCAPIAQDEIAMAPFKDPSGLVLRSLLRSVQLDSNNTWLTNLFKFKFPNNRSPYHTEIQCIRYLLYAEWVAIDKPRTVITIGPTATTAVLGMQAGQDAQAGQPQAHISRCKREMCIMPMLHPMHGLQNLKVREVIEQHWNKLDSMLQHQSTSEMR